MPRPGRPASPRAESPGRSLDERPLFEAPAAVSSGSGPSIPSQADKKNIENAIVEIVISFFIFVFSKITFLLNSDFFSFYFKKSFASFLFKKIKKIAKKFSYCGLSTPNAPTACDNLATDIDSDANALTFVWRAVAKRVCALSKSVIVFTPLSKPIFVA